MKAVRFLGDSLERLRKFPEGAGHDAGYQLELVQRGEQPDDFKPLPSIGKGVRRDSSARRWGHLSGDLYRPLCRYRLCIACISKENTSHIQEGFRNRESAISEAEEGTGMSKGMEFASVWDAIADSPEQAANLRTRAELMRSIAAIVKKARWTQAEAARRCGVTQPRINDLLRGRVSRFSLDALVNIAACLGRRVRVKIEAA